MQHYFEGLIQIAYNNFSVLILLTIILVKKPSVLANNTQFLSKH